MILLDTHVWLWVLHDPTKLSNKAQTLISQEELKNGLRFVINFCLGNSN